MLKKLNTLDSQYYLSINGLRTIHENSWANISEKFDKFCNIYIRRGFDMVDYIYKDSTDEYSAIFVKDTLIKILEVKLYK